MDRCVLWMPLEHSSMIRECIMSDRWIEKITAWYRGRRFKNGSNGTKHFAYGLFLLVFASWSSLQGVNAWSTIEGLNHIVGDGPLAIGMASIFSGMLTLEPIFQTAYSRSTETLRKWLPLVILLGLFLHFFSAATSSRYFLTKFGNGLLYKEDIFKTEEIYRVQDAVSKVSNDISKKLLQVRAAKDAATEELESGTYSGGNPGKGSMWRELHDKYIELKNQSYWLVLVQDEAKNVLLQIKNFDLATEQAYSKFCKLYSMLPPHYRSQIEAPKTVTTPSQLEMSVRAINPLDGEVGEKSAKYASITLSSILEMLSFFLANLLSLTFAWCRSFSESHDRKFIGDAAFLSASMMLESSGSILTVTDNRRLQGLIATKIVKYAYLCVDQTKRVKGDYYLLVVPLISPDNKGFTHKDITMDNVYTYFWGMILPEMERRQQVILEENHYYLNLAAFQKWANAVCLDRESCGNDSVEMRKFYEVPVHGKAIFKIIEEFRAHKQAKYSDHTQSSNNNSDRNQNSGFEQ